MTDDWTIESPLFHVTQVVDRLDVALDVYERLFARPVLRGAEKLGRAAIFSRVGDQLVEAMIPGASAAGMLKFVERFGSHWHSIGWYVRGIDSLAQDLLDAGVHISTSEWTAITAPPVPRHGPDGAMSSADPEWSSAVFWTRLNQERGIHGMHEFCEPTTKHELARWRGAEPLSDDPLGVVRGSHCTIAVADGARAARFWCDVMHGEPVEEGERDALGAYSRWVRLGEAPGILLELAEPVTEGPVSRDLSLTAVDILHSCTFRVRDLDDVRAHVSAERFGTEVDTEHLVVTDPASTAGARYGFTDVGVG